MNSLSKNLLRHTSIMTRVGTATEYDIWSRKIKSKKALDEMVRHNEELGLYTEEMSQDEYESDTEREWVGLDGAWEPRMFYIPDFIDGANWAENKLKELNT